MEGCLKRQATYIRLGCEDEGCGHTLKHLIRRAWGGCAPDSQQCLESCVASRLFGPRRCLGLSTQEREILTKCEGAGLSKAVRLESWGDMEGEALPGHPKALHTLWHAGSWPVR